MADFSIDDLTTPLTRQEVQQSIYEVLAILGVNTTTWKPGAVVRTMIVATSVVISALSSLQAQIARSGFLQFAEGDWLTLVALYVYGVERIEATFAVGELTLTNTGGGVYTFDPDDLVFSNPERDNKTYRNTEAVSLGALSTVTIPIQATEAGSASSAEAGQINTMVTTVIGVVCSNVAQLTGADQESDAALRNRCSEKLGSLSPMGPWDAYSYAARNAKHDDGSSIGVTRIRITKDGYGNVTTYLAGIDGAITGDPDDPDTDLGIANEAIQRNAAPLAVNAIVTGATNHVVAVEYEVWIYNTSGKTEAEIQEAIASALSAFLRAQPIGGNVIGSDPGKIFVHAIRAAIFDALPEIFQVQVTVPAADIELLPEEVATDGVFAPVSLGIHQEPPPEGFGGAL